ncbi:hypothetical protein A0H81_14991 [Grifola frondosa]|uniref:Uncharacterized protein n=1 Tax=Grifola frondosa TaxID=5627 RepID=A0A1C7LLX1_GRIFR|nr:hypothetical protein A0H81_14991 [Grifola frondosa]
MNEMSSLEVAHIINVLNYTIRRLEDAVQHEEEDIIKSARIAFASGLLWASDVATMGRVPVIRSVSVGSSSSNSVDNSIVSVAMEDGPLEAQGVEPVAGAAERSIVSAAMEDGPLEAQGAEPAAVGRERVMRSW